MYVKLYIVIRKNKQRDYKDENVVSLFIIFPYDNIYKHFTFYVSSTVLWKNRNTDLLYIKLYIWLFIICFRYSILDIIVKMCQIIQLLIALINIRYESWHH